MAQVDAISEDKATSHRNIYRGKNLGNVFTDEQKAAISSGTFEDLYVGDYWEINGYKWRIVDINYWMKANRPINDVFHLDVNHLTIMPDLPVINSVAYNSTNNAEGYRNSTIRSVTVSTVYDIVKQAFGDDNILRKKEGLLNSVGTNSNGGLTSGSTTVETMVEVPTYESFFGNMPLILPGVVTSIFTNNYLENNIQLAAFRLNPLIIINSEIGIWCRDIRSTTHSIYVSSRRLYGEAGCTETWCGIRPIFGIIG